MPQCSVPGCRTKAKRAFHFFPHDPVLCQQWLEIINNPDLPPDTDVHGNPLKLGGGVCGRHFRVSEYERDLQHELMGYKKKQQLKENALPSLFLPKNVIYKRSTDNVSINTDDEDATLWHKGHLGSSAMKLGRKAQKEDKRPSSSTCATKDNEDAVFNFGKALSHIVEPVATNLCFAVQRLASVVSQQRTQFVGLVESVEKVQCRHDNFKKDFDDFMQSAKLKCGKKRKMESQPFSYFCSTKAKKQKRVCFIPRIHHKTYRSDTVRFLEEIKHMKGNRVTVSLIRRNPDLCEKYTGFSNYIQLKEVFNKIVADPNFSGHKTESGESCLRKLSLESEFLMTLVKIKLMVPLCYLCSQYKVPRSVVRETVVKWTGVLMKTLRGMDRESKDGSLQPLFTQTKRFLHQQRLMDNGDTEYG